MEKKNIESILKTKSENYHEEVRPKLWDKLEKRMDDHYASKTPKKVIQLAWVRYAAAIVLLLSAGFLLSRIDTGDSLIVAEQFTLEELSIEAENDQLYEDMINFSQKMYRPLVSSGEL